ncbi:uncharacterized protein ACA1_174110 [Acanthamoeba castellanii str. Neff]|uniref:Uncharacterized protein n=1 Tax=Acanthamoeba castellanii (strain ATCC 30010 / Neff) TaxID=1257118 RepID=L8HHR4_ACACF|nr:uncharacterized protein ACA1_174110 [Acanthamoeba castellanii str. Neff]ELR24752.1 hypothetical protein ACA1_174110 [Acanthamoeba castellanii str. Neff]
MHARAPPAAAPLLLAPFARRAAHVLTLTRGRRGTLLLSTTSSSSSNQAPAGGQREEEDEPAQENDPSLAAEAAEMAMDPDDAPPQWTDAIRRFSTAISSVTIRLDDVGHHRVGDAGDVRPAGQGLMKTSRKLPKLRSMRETTSTEEGRSQAKLTATVLAKVLEARRETGGESVLRLHELANRLHVEQSALEAVLRYHDDLPEYKAKLQDLAQLAK